MTDLTLNLSDSVTQVETLNFNIGIKLADSIATPIDALGFSGSLIEHIPPINITFHVSVGDDFIYTFPIVLPNDILPLCLAGYSVSTKFASTLLYETAGVITSTVSGDFNALVTLSLTHEETALLDAGRYVFSSFLIAPDGKRFKIIGGILVLWVNYSL